MSKPCIPGISPCKPNVVEKSFDASTPERNRKCPAGYKKLREKVIDRRSDGPLMEWKRVGYSVRCKRIGHSAIARNASQCKKRLRRMKDSYMKQRVLKALKELKKDRNSALKEAKVKYLDSKKKAKGLPNKERVEMIQTARKKYLKEIREIRREYRTSVANSCHRL